MERICIQGGRIVLPDRTVSGNLIAEDGVIREISDRVPEDCRRIDASNCLVTPGFIETHAHGAGGADFMDAEPAAFCRAVMTHVRHGVTTICPTTMSGSFKQLAAVFDTYRAVRGTEAGTHLHGLHLEGPFLNPTMCGAQNADMIRQPSPEEVDAIFEAGDGILTRISCAPELDGIPYLAKRAVEAGILLSVAHSAATAEQLHTALAIGFSHVTHMYSATTSVRKLNQRIYAGIVEAAYLYDGCFVELIGDGRHVARETMQLALKIKGPDKINLTSDAMRAAGQEAVQESFLGPVLPENRVIIEDGVAKLPDRSSYAGSIALGDRMFRNAVLNYDIPILSAVKMLAQTPARLIGAKKKGTLEPGKDCDLLLWDRDLNLKQVFCAGKALDPLA